MLMAANQSIVYGWIGRTKSFEGRLRFNERSMTQKVKALDTFRDFYIQCDEYLARFSTHRENF